MTDTLVQPSTTLWTERAAAWIDTRFQEQFSRYRRDYVQYLARRCRDFDVKGTATQGAFALELMRVFVEPDVVFYPLPETSSDLTRLLPRELCQGRLAIWDYMRSESLAGQNLAIVGPPGCGKTTLLKHVALTLAADRKQRRQRRAPDKLPILLVLRDLVQAIEENADLSLAQAVLDNLDRQDGPTAPQGWFARQLEQGRCLVMLDGLDEIADPNGRRQVAAWVERQMSVWHKNRFVVSSRIDGYRSNSLSGVIVLRISPFEGDQVDRLAFNWCAANVMANTHHDDAGVRTKARQEAEDMLRRIRNVPVLAVLAANPLLLTLLANVHHCSDSLPGSRTELYAKSCHVSLGERTASQGPETGLTLSQKQHTLSASLCPRRADLYDNTRSENFSQEETQGVGQNSRRSACDHARITT